MFSYKDIDQRYITERIDFTMIAMEADINTGANAAQPNTENGVTGQSGNSIWKKIEQLLAKILATIEEKLQRLRTNLKRIMQTSYGFETGLANAKKKKAPLQNHLKIITYKYNTQFLETVRKLVDKTIVDLVNEANNYRELAGKSRNSILLRGPSEVESYILKTCQQGLPQSPNTEIYKDDEGNPIKDEQGNDTMIEDPKEQKRRANGSANVLRYLHYVRQEYHGQKFTKLVNTADVSQYEKVAMETKGIGATVDGQIRRLHTLVKEITGRIKADMLAAKDDAEQTRALMTISKSIHNASQFYTTFYEYYQDLRFEEMFAAREVVRRVYQF